MKHDRKKWKGKSCKYFLLIQNNEEKVVEMLHSEKGIEAGGE